MENLSIQQLTELACIRYGQLVAPIDIYNLGEEECFKLLESIVEEYSYYVPMTKILRVNGSVSGTFLGDDVISVRNVRMTNFYFGKLSPRMSRRQREFNPHTKMLYVPIAMPITVECGVKYPIERSIITDTSNTYLIGDISFTTQLYNYRQGTLKIKIDNFECNDLGVDYTVSPVILNVTSGQGTAEFNTETNTLSIKDLNITTSGKVEIQYNTDKPVVQGLSLRDTRFIDLFIGRLMLALGNIKAQLVMEGDVVGFASDELISQGQTLVDTTLDILRSSSTSYKII